MLIISHRGNLNGPEGSGDCDRDRVLLALRLGFDVEIDVRCHQRECWVGHDEPLYRLSELVVPISARIWFHAKDLESFRQVVSHGRMAFAHAVDAFVPVVNTDAIWVHPNQNENVLFQETKVDDLVLLDVAGYPRLDQGKLQRFPFAVCTDWPLEWAEWWAAKLRAGWR